MNKSGQKGFSSPLISLSVVIAVVFLAIGFYFGIRIKGTPLQNKSQQTIATPSASPTTTKIANPAATHCIQIGGKTEIKKNSDGSESGMCTLSGVTCEEWALLRGECPAQNTQEKSASAPSTTVAEIANPASVNCIKEKGTLTIQTRGDGGQYGVCDFGSGYQCEEWALMRGDCKKPGVKTTGFTEKSQIYCALLGGKTLAEKNATCTFNDGSVCDNNALYNGTCHKGQY